MDVYLIPIGNGEYELYCESGDEPETVAVAPTGLRGKLLVQFQTVVAAAEQARRRHAQGDTRRDAGAWSRLKARALRWIAEKIAEQRLLWRLPGQHQVSAWFPDDLTSDQASEYLRANLRGDADRHRRWLLVNGAGLVGSLALIPIPGPNLLLYYFTFRVGGHYLSRRGARHGLADVQWELRPSSTLTELRQALALEPGVRQQHVTEIASRLRLPHLAAFFERIAIAAP